MDQSEHKSMLRGHYIQIQIMETVLQDESLALQTLEQLMEATWQQRREISMIPLEASEQDFCEPFVGPGSVELHHELGRDFRRNDLTYPAVIPILQSSGVGKTRTVIELSTHAPGLMLCLRRGPMIDSRMENPLTTSLPQRDASVCAFLLGEDMYVTPEHGTKLPTQAYKDLWFVHCRVTALLAATTQVIAEQIKIEKEAVDVDIWKKLGHEEAWPLILERMSHKFFDGIVRGYVVRSTSPQNCPERQQQSAETSKRKELIDDIISRSTMNFREYQKHIPEPDGNMTVYKSRVAERLASFLVPHLEDVKKHSPGSHQYVFVALDEFDTFGHLLPTIRRLMSVIQVRMKSRDPLRVLLLDTNIELGLGTWSVEQDPSMRGTDGSKPLREPYLIISPDTRLLDGDQRVPYDDFLENKMVRTHGEILKFLRYMGRPLWGDRLYDYRSGPWRPPYAGLSLANVLTKMGCQVSRDEQYIALAASRLPLTVVGLQGESISCDDLSG